MVTSSPNTSRRTLAAAATIAAGALTLLFLALRIEEPVAGGPPVQVEGSVAPAGDLVAVRVAAPGVSFGGRRQGGLDGASDDEADVVATASAAVLRARVKGRVLHANGRAPIFGVPLGLAGEASHEIVGWSAAEGRFEVEVDPGEQVVETHGSSWATVVAAPLGEDPAAVDAVLVAAPAMDVAGFVVRADGSGVADAAVRLALPAELLEDLPAGADPAGLREFATSSSQRGYFELLSIPAVRGATVEVTGEGFAPKSFELPTISSYDRTWVVDDPAQPAPAPAVEEGPVLRGTVLRADAEPAGDARVRLGALETTCDWQGAFALPLEELVEGAPLYAWLPGLEPAFVPGFATVLAERPPDEDAPLVLQLGGPLPTLRGRVVDADGAPATSWVVAPVSARGAYPALEPPLLLEELVGGGKLPEATTDLEGAFELAGLLPRDYRVRAWDPETLVSVAADVSVPPPTADGAPAEGAPEAALELVVPADALLDRLAGRVESAAGRPLAGATVRLRLLRARTSAGPVHRDGAAAIADAEGRFELARVPRSGVELVVTAETVDERAFPLRALERDAEGDLRVVVPERAELRVESDDPDAVRVALLGPEGAPTPLAATRDDVRVVQPYAELVDGTTAVLTAAEGAWTLVVYADGGVELGRAAVELTAGERTVVSGPPGPEDASPHDAPPAEAAPAPAERAPEASGADAGESSGG